jgi:K+-sensing histidine kinase KdpD
LVEPYAPFHLFIVACTIIAFFYGYKLALLSIVTSIALGGYYFVKPYKMLGPLNELNPTDWLQFFNFFLVSLVAIFFIEKLQRNIFERDLLLKVMQSRYRIELIKKNESQISLNKKI